MTTFMVRELEKNPELEAMHKKLVEATFRLASSYTSMCETLITSALTLGHSLHEMEAVHHEDCVPSFSRRFVLYVKRNGTKERFGEVSCLCEDLKFRLRMNIETEKEDA